MNEPSVSSQGNGSVFGPCHIITPLAGFTTCLNHLGGHPRCILSSPGFVEPQTTQPIRGE